MPHSRSRKEHVRSQNQDSLHDSLCMQEKAPKEEQIRVQIQFCLRTPSAENGATKPFLDLIQIRKDVPPSSSCGSVDHFEIRSASCWRSRLLGQEGVQQEVRTPR